MVRKLRPLVQIGFTAVTNGYVFGFLTGKIYTGPGALGSCPIGALQAVLTGGSRFSFYVVGFLLLFGSIFGRFICGWLCPFGLVQDLLHKIPVPGKRKNLPGHRPLVWLKYGILAVFVVLLPMFAVDGFGQSKPWFCQYICPSGTLMAGIPLVASSEALQAAAGALFNWKVGLLIVTVLLAVWIYRPFCKYVCPLGAVYTSPECIRCGAFIHACPVHALKRDPLFSPKAPVCSNVKKKEEG